MSIKATIKFTCACGETAEASTYDYCGKSRWEFIGEIDATMFHAVHNEIGSWQGEFPNWRCKKCVDASRKAAP